MTIDEMIEVLQAYNNGETIQQQSKLQYSEEWYDNANPTWNHVTFDYRVKPKPREVYVTVYNANNIQHGGVYNTRETATNWLNKGGKVVKFIEVIE